MFPDFDPILYEKNLWKKNIRFVAGLDEAGRGPLAGPVVAGVVVFPPFTEDLKEIGDSKKFSSLKRQELFELIKKSALDWGVGIVDERIIERINILQATHLAMSKAVENLKISPQFLLIDGLPASLPTVKIPQQSIIKGDEKSLSIGAASIIAKVVRDRIMEKYHRFFPAYGFNAHKGYPTKSHFMVLEREGPSPIHRRTYYPVSKILKVTTPSYRERHLEA